MLGAGVTGLSHGILLTQAGFEVDVYERHPDLSQMGAGIVCWPNACFVLQQLGVLETLSEVAGKPVAMNRYSHTGEAIGSLNINQLNRLMGYPSYSVLRRDLMKLLFHRAMKVGINIHFGHQVSQLHDAQSQTHVQFENGLTIAPDIIVGAEGRMKSLSRKYVHGDNTPIYQGIINWVGIFSGHTACFSNLSISDDWGTGERFGIVPISDTMAYWAGGVLSDDSTAPGRHTITWSLMPCLAGGLITFTK